MCKDIFTLKSKGTGVQDTARFHFLVFYLLKYSFQYFTAVVFLAEEAELFIYAKTFQ